MSRPDRAAERSFAIWWRLHAGVQLSAADMDRFRAGQDPPDFRIPQAGEQIAVEHTHVFRESGGTTLAALSPPHSLAIQRRICKHATELLRRMSGVPAVSIQITFASCDRVRKNEERKISSELCDLVAKRLRGGDSISLELYMPDLSAVSSCLGRVQVDPGGKSSSVSRHAQARVDEWGLPAIGAAAFRKAKDLPRYRTKFDQCWLLLGVGGAHPRQWIEPSPEACLEGIATDFDRVFVVDEGTEKVYEIATRRR